MAKTGDEKRLPSGRSHPIYWVAGLTLAFAALLVGSAFMGVRLAKRHPPLVDAAMEIKLELALAHLRFEESLGGDSNEDVAAVWAHIDEAQWYATAMLEGGENPEGTFIPLEDSELRREIEESQAMIVDFRAIATQRWAALEQSGIGSDIDQRFDSVFTAAIHQVDTVETALQAAIAEDVRRFEVMQSLLIALCLGLGGGAGILLHAYERIERTHLQTLQKSQEDLSITLESIADAVIATDVKGRVTRMNSVAQAMTGWTESEALARPLDAVFNIINAQTREMVEAPVDKVLREGNIVGLANHTLLIARDGTEHQIADSAAPIRNTERVVVGVVLVFRDVTKEYTKEQQLRESENRLRSVFRAAPIGIGVVIDRVLKEVNTRLCQMTGYSNQELRDQRARLLYLSDEDYESVGREKYGQIREHDTGTVETRWKRKDGRIIDVLLSSTPLDLNDLSKGVTFTALDISDRKRAEQELRERAKELASLNKLALAAAASLSLEQVVQTAIDEVVDTVDCELALVFVRDGNRLVLQGSGPGYSPFLHEQTPVHRVGECLCGLTVSDEKAVYSEDIYNDHRCTWDECKQAGLRSFAGLPLRCGDEIIGVLGLGSKDRRDFSDQGDFLEALSNEVALGLRNALLHEEIQRYAVELEERVADRTRNLYAKTSELEKSQTALHCLLEEVNETNRDLEVAKRRAEDSDRLKSVFLATMSHELRTPLNSIIGFTGIVLQGLTGPLNDEQNKQLGMVQGSARHLLDLINDVLDISKIEAGQLEVHSDWFDMRESIHKVVGAVAPLAERKGLTLEVDVAREVGTLLNDQRRVEQVLINLANNAVKFTETGTVRIECTVDQGQVVTRVVDTGRGIKTKDVAMLFTPFTQIDTGLNRNHEGTGLGLSICSKLAEALGGKISVESEWRAGSVFTFTIPAGQERKT